VEERDLKGTKSQLKPAAAPGAGAEGPAAVEDKDGKEEAVTWLTRAVALFGSGTGLYLHDVCLTKPVWA
jgi:hypothetical protein